MESIYLIFICLLLVCFSTVQHSHGSYFDGRKVFRASRQANQKNPAVSAVLLECPKKEPKNCERQMMVNIRVSPSFNLERTERYLVLDELYDQRKKAKAKIMSPYLIEISRGEPVVMYPLEFTKVNFFVKMKSFLKFQIFQSVKCESCEQNQQNDAEDTESKVDHQSKESEPTAASDAPNVAPLQNEKESTDEDDGKNEQQALETPLHSKREGREGCIFLFCFIKFQTILTFIQPYRQA